MNLKKYIGHRVRLARKKRGMTQEQLAEAAERAVETISNIERGHSYTGIETLERLAEVLGTPVRDFFEEAGELSGATKELLELEDQIRELVRELPDGGLLLAADIVGSLVRHKDR